MVGTRIDEIDDRIVRSPRRARLVRAVAAVVLFGHGFLLVRSYVDPHNFFGFQPFNESSTWRADIVRVTVDGRRVPIEEAWPGGYEWDALVGWRILYRPSTRGHAFSGLDATVDFLDEALDWVAEQTPDDHETLRLEARVEGWRNGRGPEIVMLRSEDRDVSR